MTVKELIEKLSALDPAQVVYMEDGESGMGFEVTAVALGAVYLDTKNPGVPGVVIS